MLDEYILNKLEEIQKEKEDLKNELLSLSELEGEETKKIDGLLEKEDVGMELFSPRSENKPLKVQIEELRQHIDDIKDKEALVMDKIEKNEENEKKYRDFLQEAKSNNRKDEPEDAETEAGETPVKDTIEIKTEVNRELEVLLKRVERCISLVHSDRTKCKNELKNIRYYIMAMLSKQNTD